MTDKERIAALETEVGELKKKQVEAKDILEILRLIGEVKKQYVPLPYPVYPQPVWPYSWWGIYPPYQVGDFPTVAPQINPHITYTPLTKTSMTAEVPQNRIEVYYG